MEIKVTGQIPVSGDCGHQFEIPLSGLEGDFECPTCGARDHFTEEQVASIKEQVRDAAAKFGIDHIRQELGDSLARGLAGSKNITYRRK